MSMLSWVVFNVIRSKEHVMRSEEYCRDGRWIIQEQCSLLKEGKHIRNVISRQVWSLLWYPYTYFCPSVHPPIYWDGKTFKIKQRSGRRGGGSRLFHQASVVLPPSSSRAHRKGQIWPKIHGERFRDEERRECMIMRAIVIWVIISVGNLCVAQEGEYIMYIF